MLPQKIDPTNETYTISSLNVRSIHNRHDCTLSHGASTLAPRERTLFFRLPIIAAIYWRPSHLLVQVEEADHD